MYFKSISSRIILSVVPIIAISTLAFIVIVLHVTTEQVNEQINEKMAESINAARLEIENELIRSSGTAKAIAVYMETCSVDSIENGEMAGYLTKIIPPGNNTIGGGSYFEPYGLYPDRRYFGQYVYIGDGKVKYEPDYAYASGVDYHSTEWYQNGKISRDHTVYWSTVYYDPLVMKFIVTATVPFFDKNGVMKGVAITDMSLSDIQRIVSSVSVGETGRTFMLGANGEYISFIDSSRGLNDNIRSDSNEHLAKLGKMMMSYMRGSASVELNGED